MHERQSALVVQCSGTADVVKNVIGHREGLRSPYHHERVRSLGNQTHGDMRHRSMRIYRHKLRRMKPCLKRPRRPPVGDG